VISLINHAAPRINQSNADKSRFCVHTLRHWRCLKSRRRLANAKDDKRLGIIRIHRGIVCLSPGESHSHTHTHTHIGVNALDSSPPRIYTKDGQKERENSLMLLLLRMVYSTNSSAAIVMAAGLIVLHCYNSSLAKRLTLGHIKHQQPAAWSLSSLRFGAGVAFNSLLLRLSE
jgi:hypothetical protein